MYSTSVVTLVYSIYSLQSQLHVLRVVVKDLYCFSLLVILPSLIAVLGGPLLMLMLSPSLSLLSNNVPFKDMRRSIY